MDVKSPKMIVTIFCLFLVIIGCLSIYFFVERSERSILALLLAASVMLIRQVMFKVISTKVK